MKVVSVFGGAAPKPGSPPYEAARHLGRQLAENGLTVATGGFAGVMEAASRGAAEAGGHVIGVTCELIETMGYARNNWVIEEIRYITLRERLYHLVEKCDAAIALPGGVGTLSEVALTWSLLQTGEIQLKPFVLVGDTWQAALTTFHQGAAGYIAEKHWQLLSFAPDVEAAARLVAAALRPQPAGV